MDLAKVVGFVLLGVLMLFGIAMYAYVPKTSNNCAHNKSDWPNNRFVKDFSENLHLPVRDAFVNYVPMQFAQSAEDLVLEGFIRTMGLEFTKIRYLDIGAYDPIASNNTFLFYHYGATGVLVEPHSHQCDRIRKARPKDKLVCGVAVSGKSGKTKLYVNSHEELSSLKPLQAEKYKQWFPDSHVVFEKEIDGYNINEILQENFTDGIDLLSTDIEGFDFEILSAIDYTRFKPKIIITKSMLTETEKLLTKNGYTKVWVNKINHIYLDNTYLIHNKSASILLGRKELVPPHTNHSSFKKGN